MREIKFRVWDSRTPNPRMYCFDNLQAISKLDETWFYDDFIWEQYTGLKDKNGKEIYVGDIVKYPVFCDHTGDLNSKLYKIHGEVPKFMMGKDPLYMEDAENIEVVGNIHENPELLEAK